MLLDTWKEILYSADKGGAGGDPPDPPDEDEEDIEDEADENGDEDPEDDDDDDLDLNGDFDADRAMTTIRAQRQERRELRQQLSEARRGVKKLEAEEKARQRAEMDELERVKDELAELQAEHKETIATLKDYRLERAFNLVVAKEDLTFASPQAAEDAFALLDLEEITVDDGEVDSRAMKKAVKALQLSREYLFTAQKPGHGTPPRGRGATQPATTPPAGGDGGTEPKRPRIDF